jgi:hypothetical protein
MATLQRNPSQTPGSGRTYMAMVMVIVVLAMVMVMEVMMVMMLMTVHADAPLRARRHARRPGVPTAASAARLSVLDSVGQCWTVLDGVGQCWTVLDSVGQCWTVLDSVGQCYPWRLHSPPARRPGRLRNCLCDQVCVSVRQRIACVTGCV